VTAGNLYPVPLDTAVTSLVTKVFRCTTEERESSEFGPPKPQKEEQLEEHHGERPKSDEDTFGV
jgi:hypothetical protein